MVFALRLDNTSASWAFKQRSSSSPSDPYTTPSLDLKAELDTPAYSETSSEISGKEGGTKGVWIPAQTYPSEVHVELLKRGLIKDPYKGFEEHNVQWIGEVEWLYKCSFRVRDKDVKQGDKVELEFQGLDTLCDVYLNGHELLKANNQFRTWVVTVPRDSLIFSEDKLNVLLLHFTSAKKLSLEEEQKYGAVRAGSTNLGQAGRVYVRKAQYDWRWDWGPELMTCGPYRPIILRSYGLRIKDVYPRASLRPDGNGLSPYLNAQVTLSGASASSAGTLSLPDGAKLSLQLIDKSTANSVIVTQEASPTTLNVLAKVKGEDGEYVGEGADEDLAVIEFGEAWKEGSKRLGEEIKAWWPVGYGEQPLYDVKVQLLDKDGVVLDESIKTTGFRSVKLIEEPIEEADQHGKGTSFLFEVNGVRVFLGGSNWIPADNFLTTITDERYRAWLQLLKDGNQNMVRIWGGGVYEPDVFYDICDELGILVWHDFQFACGVYPAHPSFLSTVRAEAITNVARLRSHPSIALWCGNNEDYQMVLQWGDVAHLPAVKIYEELLPEVVGELSTEPPVPYWRGSPYGGKGWDTADPTIGDVHQWNVWGGKEFPYQNYDILGGRFVSEFGMPAMPNWKTIQYWMDGADKKEWYHQSPLIAQHCRAGMFERRFSIPMNENFRVTEDLETYAFTTQIMQAEAVGFAYKAWRRQWKGKGKEYCSGVIVWQLNDCWPVTSWAIADYFLRKKLSYYVIARELAPVTVAAQRTVNHNRASDRPRAFYEFGATQSFGATLDIWGTNSTLSNVEVTVEINAIDLKSPSWKFSKAIPSFTLLSNRSTEILSEPVPCPSLEEIEYDIPVESWTTSSSVVVHVKITDTKTGIVLSRVSDWPQPYRYIDMKTHSETVGLSVDVVADGNSVRLESKKPVKGLVLGVEGGDEDDVVWGDNSLDLFPGDVQVIEVKGLEGRGVTVRYLGKEKL